MKRLSLVVSALALSACAKPQPGAAPPTAEAPLATASDPDPAWPDEPFRYQRPEPGSTPEVPIPGVEVFELAGGLQVYLVERHELPVVSFQLSFDLGSVDDPPRKAGLTSVCMDLLGESTAKRDKIALAEALADLASSVSSHAGLETSGIHASALRRNMEPTLELMMEVLQTPGLRQDDFDRLVEREKAAVVQAKAAPFSVGLRLWGSIVWGPDHPYGRIVTEASLDAIELADCRRLARRLGPKGAKLFVFGDVDRGELETVLAPKLRRWKGAAPRQGEVPAPSSRGGVVFFVDVPGAAQSQLIAGHTGPRRQAEDYAATSIMERILGGSFSSRINMNIREDKGYAYGARAGFSYRRNGSTFWASSSVRTDATADALREIVAEIRRMHTGTIGAEELMREREGTLLSLPAEFSTGRRILETYADLVEYELPLNWYESYQSALAGMSAEAVGRAAQRHLAPNELKVLVAGDAEETLAGIQKLVRRGILGGKEIIVLDGDGNELRRVDVQGHADAR